MAARTQPDRGLILPMVLVVTVVLGIVVVGLASYGTANLRYGRVAEERSDQLAAADAAMLYAVDLLQIDRADCIFTDVAVVLPVLASSFNGATGSVECETISGGLEDIRNYAAAITGENLTPTQALVVTQGGSEQKVFTGPVFMQRVTPASFNLSVNAGVTVKEGPLLHYDGTSPDCVSAPKSSLPPDVKFEPDLIFGPICTPDRWFDVFTTAFDEPPIGNGTLNLGTLPLRDGTVPLSGVPTWPTVGASPVAGSYTVSGSCRVYEPGRYLRPPNLNNVNAYFKTGDYLFDFRNPTTVSPADLSYASFPMASVANSKFVIDRSDVTAGKLDTSIFATPELPNHADCIAAAAADAGFGATFYMSGRAHISISNQGALEIMPRNQGDPADPADAYYVAIHALCDWTATTNNQSRWCTSSSGALGSPLPSILIAPATNNPSTTNPNIVYTEPGNNREMVANGLIYAPLAQMEFGNVTNVAIQKMRGGLVLARAILQSSTSAQNFEIGVSTTAIDSVIRLTATGTKNGLSSHIRAIAEYRAFAEYDSSVALNSWRVCEKSGC